MATKNIVLLPGDGIGPEVAAAGKTVLETVAKKFGHTFTFAEHRIGGIAIDEEGTPLPEATLSACASADAVLLGAVGGPKWDDPNAKVRPEQGLLGLRKAFGLFANLRPVRVHPSLAELSPLKASVLDGVDILFVRELTGGLYFGAKTKEVRNGKRYASDVLEYTEEEIERVVTLAFDLARNRKKKVTSVDKANVIESSRLWRQVANEVSAKYPDVTLEHQLVDSCAMRLLTAPKSFDVVVTENMFGDILTDEAAALAGSLGLIPSASLGSKKHLGLYEPIHGSAPDIAGKGIANPIGTILSVALLLRHSLELQKEAATVEQAVDKVITEGARTADLTKTSPLSTSEMTLKICAHLAD